MSPPAACTCAPPPTLHLTRRSTRTDYRLTQTIPLRLSRSDYPAQTIPLRLSPALPVRSALPAPCPSLRRPPYHQDGLVHCCSREEPRQRQQKKAKRKQKQKPRSSHALHLEKNQKRELEVKSETVNIRKSSTTTTIAYRYFLHVFLSNRYTKRVFTLYSSFTSTEFKMVNVKRLIYTLYL